MASIDPTARVEDGAVVGDGTIIGPFCILGPNVKIGANCRLISHVNIAGHTTIGDGCTIHSFASLGGPPQSLGYRDEPTRLEIGDDCMIREGVTMSVGTVNGGGVTRIGRGGFFMAYAHIGHDCIVGDNVIFANSASLGGHCEIQDFVFMGALVGVHQFSRIGAQVMVAAGAMVQSDVIPFGLAHGNRATLRGLNVVGMKRRQFTKERIATVRSFYRSLFYGLGVFAERLAAVRSMVDDDPAIAEILSFIDGGNNRDLCMASPGRSA